MSTQQAMQRVRSAVRRPTVAGRTASTTVAFAGPSTAMDGVAPCASGMIAYVVSRLCAIAGAAVVAAQVRVADSADRAEALANGEVLDKPPLPGGLRLITNVFTSWDGKWYLEIVRTGYPRHVPPDITFNQLEACAAFFPLYPSLVHLLDPFVPGGDTIAVLFVNLVLGAVAVCLVGMLARGWWGDRIAGRAMVLFCVFPASVVLTMAYSEALLITLAAGCLLALDRRRWLLAGVLAALATATRPNGIALCAACAIAAAFAIYERREWRSLVAPILSPIGFLAFQIWIGVHAGERGVWSRGAARGVGRGHVVRAHRAAQVVGRDPPPDELADRLGDRAQLPRHRGAGRDDVAAAADVAAVGYTAVVLALMLLPSTVTARPRFLYTVFPLVLCFAAWWESSAWLQRVLKGDPDGHGWALFVGVNCAALAALTALYGVYGVIP